MLYAIRSDRMYKLITTKSISVSKNLDTIFDLVQRAKEGIVKNHKNEVMLYFKR